MQLDLLRSHFHLLFHQGLLPIFSTMFSYYKLVVVVGFEPTVFTSWVSHFKCDAVLPNFATRPYSKLFTIFQFFNPTSSNLIRFLRNYLIHFIFGSYRGIRTHTTIVLSDTTLPIGLCSQITINDYRIFPTDVNNYLKEYISQLEILGTV